MADKKGMAALIIAKAKPPKAEEAPMEADPKHAAAEELIDALKTGDPAGVVEAFSSLQEMCSYSHDEE